jgi:hypothetical protein
MIRDAMSCSITSSVRLIQAIPLSEPLSTGSRLIARPTRSTQIL